ncbi:hypothetical protein PICSAR6_04502 [Mycobacterium avium subsp. paratuberculosis]|nr:hypothetical protein PICSAR6_04502 [Mycobacterium avium subsp. paratuberculosis]
MSAREGGICIGGVDTVVCSMSVGVLGAGAGVRSNATVPTPIAASAAPNPATAAMARAVRSGGRAE